MALHDEIPLDISQSLCKYTKGNPMMLLLEESSTPTMK